MAVRLSAVGAIASAATLLLVSNARPPQSTFIPFTAHVVEEDFASGAAKVPASVSYIIVERRSDAPRRHQGQLTLLSPVQLETFLT